MPQKTAVEWLIEKIESTTHDLHHLMKVRGEFEQAKQMEKMQMNECWNVAHQSGRFEGKGIAEENWQTFKQYYNETYGK